jgi:hypothetical protein
MTIHVIDLMLDSHEPVLYQEIDEMLTEGYEIISSAVFDDGKVPTQRLIFRKDDNAAAAKTVEAVKTEVRAIVSIECRETYSKSTQQNFKFWTCTMENGEKVNVFNHPDESRNTFKIAENKGWGLLLSMDVGEEKEYFPEIAVTVSHDGEWYSLVNIIHRDLWLDLNWRTAQTEPQDMTQDDIPFDTETSDAIDNLKSGLALDDDDDEGESHETD